jgi:hypothetical protein
MAAGVMRAQRKTVERAMITELKPNADASLTTLRATLSKLTSYHI